METSKRSNFILSFPGHQRQQATDVKLDIRQGDKRKLIFLVLHKRLYSCVITTVWWRSDRLPTSSGLPWTRINYDLKLFTYPTCERTAIHSYPSLVRVLLYSSTIGYSLAGSPYFLVLFNDKLHPNEILSYLTSTPAETADKSNSSSSPTFLTPILHPELLSRERGAPPLPLLSFLLYSLYALTQPNPT